MHAMSNGSGSKTKQREKRKRYLQRIGKKCVLGVKWDIISARKVLVYIVGM